MQIRLVSIETLSEEESRFGFKLTVHAAVIRIKGIWIENVLDIQVWTQL